MKPEIAICNKCGKNDFAYNMHFNCVDKYSCREHWWEWMKTNLPYLKEIIN